MSHDFFRFKQFCIHHDRCAMKVGTDGVLLGAWGCVQGKRILDIGTGTGLIALMAAQRNPDAEVLGIDIDEAAVLQAKENVQRSMFKGRCSILKQDVLTFEAETPFDAILCNPPFFTEDTLPDNKGRALARNNKSLPFGQLIPKVSSLLAEGGKFSLIIPSWLTTEVISLCLESGLYLERRCQVRTTTKKPPRRTLLMFSFDNSQQTTDDRQQELILMAEDGSRSQQYQDLTKDFYL